MRRLFENNSETWGVLVSLKFHWAPGIVEFVLGRFSHFDIAIAYSNSKFCGAWTPSFCEFTSNFSKTSTPQVSLGCARFAEIWLKYFEFQILWSLSSVDFHTLTLQLPIQTPNSVAPELQAFVSLLAISAKRAHPCFHSVLRFKVIAVNHHLQTMHDVDSPLCATLSNPRVVNMGDF